MSSRVPATGSDPDAEAQIEAAEADVEAAQDPYADAGPDVREETDPGLDDADIDQDGNPLEEAEPEPERGEDQEPKPPPAKSTSPKPFGFLPQPTRKSTT